ncbi:MAG TPA: ABC transporter permease [Pyrinomonadaceae bacterium]|nr:ABC transporter permease [Pyrinomonadaceae bacterium]
MTTLLQDLRFGLRLMATKPLATAVAVLTLALGIGANTAVFSVINAVLIEALPYQAPEKITVLWGRNPNLNLTQAEFPASYPDFVDWQSENQTFAELAAISPNSFNLSGGSEPERVGGVGVSADFFNVLGASAVLGRVFTAEEMQPGAPPAVVVSHSFWQRRFGGDANAVGHNLTLDGKEYRVVGVMPPDFSFPQGADMPQHFGFADKVDLWTPLTLKDYEIRQRGNRVIAVIGRLKPNVSLPQAQVEMGNLARSLEQRYPDTNKGFGLEVVSLREQLVGKSRRSLLMLFAAVGFVLLITCANVANLVLARSATRLREMALRVALGASRWRIARQVLTESLLLSALGGTLGLLVSLWVTRVLVALSPAELRLASHAALDYRLLAFTLLLAAIAGICFGLWPALRTSKPNLNETLKESSSGGPAGKTMRHLLLVGEVALTLVLLVGAGLMIRSFRSLQGVDAGLNPNNVLTMQINLPLNKYPKSAAWSAVFKQLTERVEKLPGVESAATTWQLPLDGAEGSVSFDIQGRPEDPNTRLWAGLRRVSPGYFKTLRFTLLRGREFDRQDPPDFKPAVINEAMARRYWPNADPIGQHVTVLGTTREIIGVVKDAKNSSLDKNADPELYQPTSLWFMYLLVRSKSDAAVVLPAIREQLKTIDPDLPLTKVSTMEEVVSRSVAARRFNMLLLSVFGGMALLLSMVGIGGVMSYNVAQATREIGIRMALGARPRNMLWLVTRQGLVLALAGILIGWLGALGLTRLIRSLLFGVGPADPLTFVVVSLVLLAVTLLASYLPARRAARVDPIVALRYQ